MSPCYEDYFVNILFTLETLLLLLLFSIQPSTKTVDRAALISQKLDRSDEHSADIIDQFGHEYDVDVQEVRMLIPEFKNALEQVCFIHES